MRKIQPVLEVAAEKLEDAPKQQTLAAIKLFVMEVTKHKHAVAWAEAATPA